MLFLIKSIVFEQFVTRTYKIRLFYYYKSFFFVCFLQNYNKMENVGVGFSWIIICHQRVISFSLSRHTCHVMS